LGDIKGASSLGPKEDAPLIMILGTLHSKISHETNKQWVRYGTMQSESATTGQLHRLKVWNISYIK
jgi:hypothetical protein